MKTKEISLYELADRMGTAHRVEIINIYHQLKERSETYGILRDKIDLFTENLEIATDSQYAQTIKMDILSLYKDEIMRLKIK